MMIRCLWLVLLVLLSHTAVLHAWQRTASLRSKCRHSFNTHEQGHRRIRGVICQVSDLSRLSDSGALEASPPPPRPIVRIFADDKVNENISLVVAGAVIGVVTGAVVLSAKMGTSWINKRLTVSKPFATLLAASVLLAVLSSVDPNVTKPSIPAITEASLQDKTNLRRCVLRLVGTIVTIGSGFSMGIAGPAAEMGMVIAKTIASVFGIVNARSVAQCVLAGAGAGVAANFNAPLTGAVFSWEVSRRLVSPHDDRLKDVSSHRHTNLLMLACIFFSVLVVRRGNILSEPRILAKSASLWESLTMPAAEVPLLLPLGVFCGLVYRLYAQFRTSLLHWLQATMHIDESTSDGGGAVLRVRQLLRRWLLGAGVASIACAYAATHGFTQSLALGMEVVQQLLCPSITSSHLTSLRYLLSFVFIRFVLVAVCSVAKGLIGGQFAPLFFLGAGLGALFHRLSSLLMLLLTSSSVDEAARRSVVAPVVQSVFASLTSLQTLPIYVLGAATAMLACNFQAPIMATVFAMEITQSWNLSPVLFLVASVAVMSSKAA